jgi:hypothetical protein
LQLAVTPGYLGALLQAMSSDGVLPDLVAAGALAFKRAVNERYHEDDPRKPHSPYSEEEKNYGSSPFTAARPHACSRRLQP